MSWIVERNSEILREKMNAIQEVNRAAFESNQATERIRRAAVERIMNMQILHEEDGDY